MDKSSDSHDEDDHSTTPPMEVGSNREAGVEAQEPEPDRDEEHIPFPHHPGYHAGPEETSPRRHSPAARSPSRTSAPSAGGHYGMEYHHGARPPPGYHHYPYPYHQPPHYLHHRRSPPPSTSRRSSAHAFPATPASSSAVNMTGHRRHSTGSAQKVSPKSAPTPTTTTPGSASTPSGATPSSKAQRGLRHFSIMVCKHVEEKRVTTYNQVADELVRQVVVEREQGNKPKGKFDEKNIRRRVYDALNVLLAMGIISKDKKDILWRGLPSGPYIVGDDVSPEETASSTPAASPSKEKVTATTPTEVAPKADEKASVTTKATKEPADDDSDVKPLYTDESEYSAAEFEAMEQERDYLQAEIKRKNDALQEILVQQVCFHNLVTRNQRREHPTRHGPPVPPPEDEKIPLPFIICNTKPSAVVQCDMNKEKTDVMFGFDSPFEINDDNTILKRMNMDKTSLHALQSMVPEDMFDYCHQAGLLGAVLLSGEDPSQVHRRTAHYHDHERGRY